jgi:FkbM family methyltransferase
MIDEPWLLPHVPAGGGVAVDVGANRGTWSRLLAGRFAQVYAIEPNRDLLPALEALPANVTVIPNGAWKCAELRMFALYDQDVHLSTKFLAGGINTGPARGITYLSCMALYSMPIEGPVDFIKIDVEGAEAEVVEGALPIIECDRPRLLIELHTRLVDEPLVAMLFPLGYRINFVWHPLYEVDSALYAAHRWMVCEPE